MNPLDMEESNPELDSFRQEWRAEVSERARLTVDGKKKSSAPSTKQSRRPAFDRLVSSTIPQPLEDAPEGEEDGAHSEPQVSGDMGGSSRIGGTSNTGDESNPTTALEHYEKAVEKEAQGNLGDSLGLYRKAFRMDDRVDQIYKKKHFPPSSFPSKTSKINPSNAAPTVPNTAHHSLHGPPQTIKDLVAGFSRFKIEPAPPAIEGTPAPPSPLAELPEEILMHILMDLATEDIAAFVRLSQVCKRMAFLVSTEERIWKRVCQGSEIGFGAMHYQWQREVTGAPLKNEVLESDDSDEEVQAVVPLALTSDEVTESLLQSVYSSSWLKMFKLRPRIRFNGCYISTVNYMRSGQASVSQVTWGSPVHIVTYFRYLRFFRDGTVISLLTTTEPADVVHHLTKELQDTHRGGGSAYLPSIVMQNALRGRWRLSTLTDNCQSEPKDAEGDLFVETEGANERYMYRMKFSMRTAGKAARNNKLVWQGFWNYNMLTDDTGEFTLRNDKAFFFSRVKSYGSGV